MNLCRVRSRGRRVAFFAPAALLLGACTGSPAPAAPASTLDPSDALTTYTPLQDDLLDVLGGADQWEVTGGNLSGTDDGCGLVLPRATTGRDLATDGDLGGVTAVVDTVLADHGFSGAAGAIVTIQADRTSVLRISVPVDPASCDGDGSFPLPTD